VHFSRGASINTEPVNINHREIHLIKRAASVIWFSFETICGKPRAPADYLSLVKNFHTIMISGIRTIHPAEKDLILNFIYLIDILYDAHCRLILSSAVALDAIYPEGVYQQTFERTLSRLIEMQSKEYVYPNESDALTTI
jgi:cell division protein ZapE